MTSKIVLAILITFGCSTFAVADSLLHARVVSEILDNSWIYTVFNDESPTSSQHISQFVLQLNAPINMTAAPEGWSIDTDNVSYVTWYNADTTFPYLHDIAPGASRTGFSFHSSAESAESFRVDLMAWDHNDDAPGASFSGSVAAPSTSPSTVPEPAILTFLCLGFIGVWAIATLDRKNAQQAESIRNRSAMDHGGATGAAQGSLRCGDLRGIVQDD